MFSKTIPFSREGLSSARLASLKSKAHLQAASLTIAEMQAGGAALIEDAMAHQRNQEKGHSMIPALSQISPDSAKRPVPPTSRGYKI